VAVADDPEESGEASSPPLSLFGGFTRNQRPVSPGPITAHRQPRTPEHSKAFDEMNAPLQQPIGYYLNRTDEAMNTVLAGFSLTRTAWQVLNVIHNADQIPRTEVYEIMRPLADSAALFTVLASLIKSDWVALVGPDRLALTDVGRKRLGVVREQVAAFREKSMRSISSEEYQTVIRVLERMRRNLENQNPES